MPDAYGNLLGIQEFTTGTRIRLVSNLDPDVVLAAQFGVYPAVYVQRLSNDEAPHQTIFTIQALGNDSFSLLLQGIPGLEDCQLLWYSTEDGVIITIEGVDVDYGDMAVFTIDGLDSPWFALNNHDHTRVVDVSESDTSQGNQIIGFEWNGGSNQWWRAQAV